MLRQIDLVITVNTAKKGAIQGLASFDAMQNGMTVVPLKTSYDKEAVVVLNTFFKKIKKIRDLDVEVSQKSIKKNDSSVP